MTTIVVPISTITRTDVHLVWLGPIYVAMAEVEWFAERVAELLDDFGIEEDIWQDVVITRANAVSLNNAWLVFMDGLPVMACQHRTTAHRIAHLLDRYGLADVPDTPEELIS